jgi:predicted HD superfamily hydrolase involved in NAD metabolism
MIERLNNYIKTNLNKTRCLHSYGVLETSSQLVKKFQLKISEFEYKIAALGHDIAKYMNECEMKEVILKNKIVLDEYEEKRIELWHSHIGAVLLRKVFDIKEKNILDAVKYHTIGKVPMTDLLKVIYISDYIEPTRRFDLKIDINDFETIDELLLKVMICKKTYLENLNKVIHPKLYEMIKYYEK